MGGKSLPRLYGCQLLSRSILDFFRAKDGLLLETDGEKESCSAETIPLLSSYTGY